MLFFAQTCNSMHKGLKNVNDFLLGEDSCSKVFGQGCKRWLFQVLKMMHGTNFFLYLYEGTVS